MAVPDGPSQRTAPEPVSSLVQTRAPSGSLPFVLISLFLSLVIVWREIHPSPTFSALLDLTKEKRERVVRPGMGQEPGAGRKAGSRTEVGIGMGKTPAFALGGRRHRGRPSMLGNTGVSMGMVCHEQEAA